jgi:hypothetical protein
MIKGVNLGNWLVLEKWMSPGLFAGTEAELDAIYIMGGSPAVKLHPERVVTPLAGIRQRAGDRVRVEHAQGSWGDVPLPAVPPALLSTPPGSGALARMINSEMTATARPGCSDWLTRPSPL